MAIKEQLACDFTDRLVKVIALTDEVEQRSKAAGPSEGRSGGF